jgi:hypothetical protein
MHATPPPRYRYFTASRHSPSAARVTSAAVPLTAQTACSLQQTCFTPAGAVGARAVSFTALNAIGMTETIDIANKHELGLPQCQYEQHSTY